MIYLIFLSKYYYAFLPFPIRVTEQIHWIHICDICLNIISTLDIYVHKYNIGNIIYKVINYTLLPNIM